MALIVGQAKPLKPAMQFLMSTVFENRLTSSRPRAGATGYLVKSAPEVELADAVRHPPRRFTHDPGIARMVVTYGARSSCARDPP